MDNSRKRRPLQSALPSPHEHDFKVQHGKAQRGAAPTPPSLSGSLKASSGSGGYAMGAYTVATLGLQEGCPGHNQ